MNIKCELTAENFLKLNTFTDINRKMAPLQESQMQKTPESAPQLLREQDYSVSSPSTSVGSSPPPHADERHHLDETAPIDLSSDDSSCMTDSFYSEHDNNPNKFSSPLHALESSLDRKGLLGQSLTNGYSPDSLGARNKYCEATHSFEDSNSMINKGIETLECHMCNFQASNVEEYGRHIDSHFDHKCPTCDYTSRTEGRLTRHIHDFHSPVPPESWAGKKRPSDMKSDELDNSSASSSGPQKPKMTKCKQCNFTCDNKPDYYKHLQEAHMKKDKILACPKCCFVTEYKHHFEYHLRNHFGSKPFKCNKCNYNCVNKSMLNSHKKSHSKIYPYRCGNCKYATKYCHSLKIHLRKYLHKPGQTLNLDGTPNNNPVIDVYGRRRGPKGKSSGKTKPKTSNSIGKNSDLHISDDTESKNAVPNQSYIYPSPYYPSNHFSAMLMGSPPVDIQMPHFPVWANKSFRCYYCDFITDSRDLYQQHIVAHATRENSDLIRTCNINPDVFHVQAQHLTFNNYPQNSIHYADNAPSAESKNGSQKGAVGNNANVSENILSTLQSQTADISANDTQLLNNKTHTSNHLISKNTANLSPKVLFKDTKISQGSPSVLLESQKDSIQPIPYYVSPSDKQAHEYNDNLCFPQDEPFTPRRSLSSPMSSSPSSVGGFSQSNENSETMSTSIADYQCPLDLSSAKSSNQGHAFSEAPQNSMFLNSRSVMSSSDCFSSQSRNRRKGKAFKLDHYIQCEDSPLKTEGKNDARNNSDDLNHVIDVSKKNTEQVNHDVIKSFPENLEKHRALSPQYTNGSYCDTLPSEISSDNKVLNNYDIDPMHVEPKSETETDTLGGYTCKFCEMAFKDCAMYTMHMGYHGFSDPYTCNKCGSVCGNKVEFFLHLVRIAHL